MTQAPVTELLVEDTAARSKACCLDCGAPYGEDGWCDVVIPSPIWNSIAEPHDILCFRCMTKRLVAKGLENVPVIIASGPYADGAAEQWRLIGFEHGRKIGLQETAQAVLLSALKRVMPMARNCKYENFSDLKGNEDTRTEAVKNAMKVIAEAEKIL